MKILKIKSPIIYARQLGVKIGDNCRLIDVNYGSEPYLIEIGNNVSITKSQLITHDGGVWVLRNLDSSNKELFGKIKIMDNVFIGYGCIVLPGTSIGCNVIVGAGSVIKGELEPNSVYAGIPAKKISSLNNYLNRNEKKFLLTKHLTKATKRKYLSQEFKKCEP